MPTKTESNSMRFMNNPSVRQALREMFPQIERLESLDSLSNLKLTLPIEGTPFFHVRYSAIASDEFYPHVRTKLINAGVIKKHEVASTKKQDDWAYEQINLNLNSYSLLVTLQIYKPSFNDQ